MNPSCANSYDIANIHFHYEPCTPQNSVFGISYLGVADLSPRPQNVRDTSTDVTQQVLRRRAIGWHMPFSSLYEVHLRRDRLVHRRR